MIKDMVKYLKSFTVMDNTWDFSIQSFYLYVVDIY